MKEHPEWDPMKMLEGTSNIRWGTEERDQWFAPGSIQHPLTSRIISEIQANWQLFEGRDVWIGGGVLQPWYSWDIDLFIEGQPSDGAKYMLEWCAGLGFYYGVFIDVKLVTKYADVRLWQDTRKVIKFKNYIHSPEFYRDGVQSDSIKSYVKEGDLWTVDSQIPVDKNLENDAKGFKYNYGIRIL